MLQITTAPIGQGRERACYVHPDDPAKAVKIPLGRTTTQSRREIEFYRKLGKRAEAYAEYIPLYYGQGRTNLGDGIVVELIRDHDGSVSRPLHLHLADGYPVEEFEPYPEQLHASFLQNLIIFNHDLHVGNLLFQKRSPRDARLVAIDGIGDVVALDWLDAFAPLVRRKIERRWARFAARIYRTGEVRAQRATAASAKSLKPDS